MNPEKLQARYVKQRRKVAEQDRRSVERQLEAQRIAYDKYAAVSTEALELRFAQTNRSWRNVARADIYPLCLAVAGFLFAIILVPDIYESVAVGIGVFLTIFAIGEGVLLLRQRSIEAEMQALRTALNQREIKRHNETIECYTQEIEDLLKKLRNEPLNEQEL